MRAVLPLALVLMVLAPGCLETEADRLRAEGATLEARLLQAESEGRDARRRAEELAAEVRAEKDHASRLLNQSASELAGLRAEMDAAGARVAALEADLAAREAALHDAELRLADAAPLQETAAALREARAELDELRRDYDAALNRTHRSLTSVRNANFTWRFTDLRGDARAWTYPMEAYRQDVKASRPLDMLAMPTKQGRTLLVADPRPYVRPEAFAGHVRELTEGRSDRDFVREAVNMKRQLVAYQFALVDEKGYYKYPVETLGEGTGVCGDTVILLASLLLAGSEAADHGLSVALWAVKFDLAQGAIVTDPEDVNHAILEVTFRDGERWLVETTALDLSLYPDVSGWRFPIEA